MAQQTDISKMETTQTALEWLVDEIEKQAKGQCEEIPIWIYIYCEQAKVMEKKQILDAYNEAYYGDKYKWKGSEEYFNQIFKK